MHLTNLKVIYLYRKYGVPLKPQSDIHCNRSATNIQNDRRGVATRFCSWSATNRGLVAD